MCDKLNDIKHKIVAIFSEVLQRPIASIDNNATLAKLDIESVEFLELSFSIEEVFKIKISKSELWNIPNYIYEKGFYSQGILTKEAMDLIESQFAQDPAQKLAKIQNPRDILSYLNIDDVAHVVCNNLNRNTLSETLNAI